MTPRMTPKMTTRILTPIMIGTLSYLSGCTVPLMGAGEAGIGYRSETKLFAFHTVDGDKTDIRSESRLDLAPLLDFLYRWKNDETTPPPDTTPDAGPDTTPNDPNTTGTPE